MSTRADLISQTSKKSEYFSDFLSNFDKSPLSNDLGRTTNEGAIKASIRNIVLTNTGERPFQRDVGSETRRSLFEPYSRFTADDIVESVKHAIKFNEPRVEIINVELIGSQDHDAYTMNILFFIINNPAPISLSLILQRVR
jgi:phage baseplate assembly protein W